MRRSYEAQQTPLSLSECQEIRDVVAFFVNANAKVLNKSATEARRCMLFSS